MTRYPIHYSILRPEHFTRLQLLMRVVAFAVLGLLGLSFGTVFAVAYLALPVFAAIRLSNGRAPVAYVEQDGPRVVAALRWLAAVSAWAGLVAERLPGKSPDETLTLEVTEAAHPNPREALWRLLTGLPSALVLALLGLIGMAVWLWAALTILIKEEVGRQAFDYLVGLQRWSIRLLAYQASLVDVYPPFTLAESEPPATHDLHMVS